MPGVPRIVVRVEVDDADVLLAVHIRESRHVGELDRVVSPDDHGDGARLRDLAHHPADRRHAALHAQVVDRRVAVIDRREFAAPRDHRLHAAHAAPHGPERGRPLTRPAVPHPHVDRGPHEGDFHLARDEVLGRARDRQPEEGEDGSDLDGSGFPRRIPGDVPVLPHREVGVARVEPDDGRVGRERLPFGTVSAAASATVSAGASVAATSSDSGGTSQAVSNRRTQEESGGREAGCHGSITSGNRRGMSGCRLGGKPTERHARGQSGKLIMSACASGRVL